MYASSQDNQKQRFSLIYTTLCNDMSSCKTERSQNLFCKFSCRMVTLITLLLFHHQSQLIGDWCFIHYLYQQQSFEFPSQSSVHQRVVKRSVVPPILKLLSGSTGFKRLKHAALLNLKPKVLFQPFLPVHMPKHSSPLLKKAACLYSHPKGVQPNELEHQNNFL